MSTRAHPSTFTVGTLPNEEGFTDDAFSGSVRQIARVLGFSRNDDGCIFITFSVCFGWQSDICLLSVTARLQI